MEDTSLLDAQNKGIFLLGACGQVGRKVVIHAASIGHKITAVAPGSAGLPYIEGVTRIDMDLATVSEDALEHELYNHEAVVFALGPKSLGSTTIYSEGISKLIRAMENAKVYRIFVITLDYDNPYGGFFFRNIVTKLVMRGMIKDMQKMEFMLKEYHANGGSVNFTVAKHFKLFNEGYTDRYKAVRLGKRHKTAWKFRTSLDDLADFILRENSENRFKNKYVCIGR